MNKDKYSTKTILAYWRKRKGTAYEDESIKILLSQFEKLAADNLVLKEAQLKLSGMVCATKPSLENLNSRIQGLELALEEARRERDQLKSSIKAAAAHAPVKKRYSLSNDSWSAYCNGYRKALNEISDKCRI